MSSNEPVQNGCEVIYEMFHVLDCGVGNQVSYDHRGNERNLNNRPFQLVHFVFPFQTT